jgi:hypothetical protein
MRRRSGGRVASHYGPRSPATSAGERQPDDAPDADAESQGYFARIPAEQAPGDAEEETCAVRTPTVTATCRRTVTAPGLDKARSDEYRRARDVDRDEQSL